MKKLFLTAMAATMMSAPMVGAQAAPVVPAVKAEGQVQTVHHVPGHRVTKKTVIKRKPNVVVKKQVRKSRWERGHRVPGWQRYRAVEYNRYGLHRPPRGYHWVRVDNDFLLIAVGSGLIASIIAGR